MAILDQEDRLVSMEEGERIPGRRSTNQCAGWSPLGTLPPPIQLSSTNLKYPNQTVLAEWLRQREADASQGAPADTPRQADGQEYR